MMKESQLRVLNDVLNILSVLLLFPAIFIGAPVFAIFCLSWIFFKLYRFAGYYEMYQNESRKLD